MQRPLWEELHWSEIKKNLLLKFATKRKPALKDLLKRRNVYASRYERINKVLMNIIAVYYYINVTTSTT